MLHKIVVLGLFGLVQAFSNMAMDKINGWNGERNTKFNLNPTDYEVDCCTDFINDELSKKPSEQVATEDQKEQIAKAIFGTSIISGDLQQIRYRQYQLEGDHANHFRSIQILENTSIYFARCIFQKDLTLLDQDDDILQAILLNLIEGITQAQEDLRILENYTRIDSNKLAKWFVEVLKNHQAGVTTLIDDAKKFVEQDSYNDLGYSPFQRRFPAAFGDSQRANFPENIVTLLKVANVGIDTLFDAFTSDSLREILLIQGLKRTLEGYNGYDVDLYDSSSNSIKQFYQKVKDSHRNFVGVIRSNDFVSIISVEKQRFHFEERQTWSIEAVNLDGNFDSGTNDVLDEFLKCLSDDDINHKTLLGSCSSSKAWKFLSRNRRAAMLAEVCGLGSDPRDLMMIEQGVLEQKIDDFSCQLNAFISDMYGFYQAESANYPKFAAIIRNTYASTEALRNALEYARVTEEADDLVSRFDEYKRTGSIVHSRFSVQPIPTMDFDWDVYDADNKRINGPHADY